MADLTTPDGEQWQPQMLAVTSARDGREHLIAEEVLAADSAGQYPAVCGRTVWANSMAYPAGPPCSECATVQAAYATSPSSNRRRTLTLLTRLIPASLRRSADRDRD